MSIVITRDLFCDCCGVWAGGGTQRTPAQIRRDWRPAGWTRAKIDGRLKDLCPKCSKAATKLGGAA